MPGEENEVERLGGFAKFTKLLSIRDVSGKAFLTSKMEFFLLSHCDFEMHIEDKVTIGSWIYLWAFYSDPLIYISVFVPIPHCLDDCGFVV